MKKYIFIIIILFYSDAVFSGKNTEKEIGKIKQYYYTVKSRIEKERLIPVSFEEQVDNTVSRYKVYSDKNNIRLISIDGGDGEYTAFEFEYLICDGLVVFIFSHDYNVIGHWSANGNNPKCFIEQYRIYLQNSKAIKILYKTLEGFELDKLNEKIDAMPNKEMEVIESLYVEKLKKANETLIKCKNKVQADTQKI